MSEEIVWPLAAVALILALALVATLVAWRRTGKRAAADAAHHRAEQAELRARVDSLARQVEVRRSPEEFVITDVGRDQPPQDPAAQRIDGRLFADIVLRESAVKAVSLGAGLRRALAPETRNRIRFEMRREVKRARKRRRADLRDLRRERAARQRTEEDVA